MTAAADTTEAECREWLAREEHREPIDLTPRITVRFLHSPALSSRTPGRWTAYAHDRAIMGHIIARADGATPEAASAPRRTRFARSSRRGAQRSMRLAR